MRSLIHDTDNIISKKRNQKKTQAKHNKARYSTGKDVDERAEKTIELKGFNSCRGRL